MRKWIAFLAVVTFGAVLTAYADGRFTPLHLIA